MVARARQSGILTLTSCPFLRTIMGDLLSRPYVQAYIITVRYQQNLLACLT